MSMFSGGRNGAGLGRRQNVRTIINPTYEIPLTRKAAGGPALATITPPIAGPVVRAMLNARLLRETAAGRSARGTCSPTEDCHAGPYSAVPQPMRKVIARSVHGVTSPR